MLNTTNSDRLVRARLDDFLDRNRVLRLDLSVECSALARYLLLFRIVALLADRDSVPFEDGLSALCCIPLSDVKAREAPTPAVMRPVGAAVVKMDEVMRGGALAAAP